MRIQMAATPSVCGNRNQPESTAFGNVTQRGTRVGFGMRAPRLWLSRPHRMPNVLTSLVPPNGAFLISQRTVGEDGRIDRHSSQHSRPENTEPNLKWYFANRRAPIAWLAYCQPRRREPLKRSSKALLTSIIANSSIHSIPPSQIPCWLERTRVGTGDPRWRRRADADLCWMPAAHWEDPRC